MTVSHLDPPSDTDTRAAAHLLLQRLGLPARPPGAAALVELAHRHVAAVPFENLDVHDPDADQTFTRVAFRRRLRRPGRGGICYELNVGFAELLEVLGYRVELLGGRVVRPGGFGIPCGHLALRVHLDRPWLVDVGFADGLVVCPITATEATPGEPPPVSGVAWSGDLPDGVSGLALCAAAPAVPAAPADVAVSIAVSVGGELGYVLDGEGRGFADFHDAWTWQRTSPGSRFTGGVVCSTLDAGRRTTIAGNRLILTDGGHRSERTLDDDELVTAYRERFGIHLRATPRALSLRSSATA
jgi:N-hydroxyarylamine O-acetyltransferase